MPKDVKQRSAYAGPVDEGVRHRAQEAGFDPDRLARAFELVAQAAADGRIPGAVMVVGRSSAEPVGPVAVGCRSLLPRRCPMEADTLFDMASITKVMATATVAMCLVERGRLRLGAPVAEYLPEFAATEEPARRQVRILHLLTHTSGLPAWRPLYQGCDGAGSCRPLMERRLLGTALEAPPGTRVTYSCLGFILLGLVIERLTGEGLDQAARRLVFEPAGMAQTGFCPGPELWGRCAATEYCSLRRRVVQGEVHDENAYFFGGVAGNAGLFSTAADTARFARLMLGRGALGERRVLSRAAVEAMTADHTSHLGESRGLGWALRGRDPDSSAGDLLSPAAYGHTGFTGTSVWIDPVRDLYCVLLTNRVHPSRNNDAHIALRPAFHNAVAAALL